MSRALLLGYTVVLYTIIMVGFVMLAWLLGEKVRRQRAATKARRDLADMRAGWTAGDDERVAALLRDDR